MAAVAEYLELLPTILQLPDKNLWLFYDAGADVLYINFKHPSYADDSELMDDDILIRYAVRK